MYQIRYFLRRKKNEVSDRKTYHAAKIEGVHEWVAKNVNVNETGTMAIFKDKDLIGIYTPIGGILCVADYAIVSDQWEYPWKLYKYLGKNELGDRLAFIRSFPNFEDISVWLNLERSFQPKIKHEIFSVYRDRQFIAEMRCERYFRPIFPSV